MRDTLTPDTEEKDLGITFDSELNFENHINNIIGKSNKMTGIIKRTFEYLDKETFSSLYKSMVRSTLEYGNTVWRPYKKGHINRLELVQRRATKCVKDIAHLDYELRLEALKLPTLEYRRMRGDMIQTYKILHSIDNINPDIFFTLSNSITRGHSFKLDKPRVYTNLRKYWFSNRVINEWNGLTEEIVSAETLNTFKNKLDKHWADRMYRYR